MLFLINVFLPKESYGEEWLGKEFLSYETIDESNYKVVRSTKNLNSDEEKQIIEYASIYNITSPDGNHEKLEDKMILRYYYPDQIKKLLTDYNFNIIEERKTEDDLFLICGLSQE
ncbi:MAG: hypothetical protein FWF94_04705 [Oscillospiraceae bacterium]|nr:hypothetical protein [Oscillospiraceae bacterium]